MRTSKKVASRRAAGTVSTPATNGLDTNLTIIFTFLCLVFVALAYYKYM